MGSPSCFKCTHQRRQLGFSNSVWAAAQPISDAEATAAVRPSATRYNSYGRGLSADVLALEPAPLKGTWALAALDPS